MSIAGTEGMTQAQLEAEIARGGRFVVFPYCVSIVVLTFRRNSAVHFVRAGEGTFGKAMPYLALSFFFGWWGFPFGLIYTPMTLFQSLSGGTNVTPPALIRGPG